MYDEYSEFQKQLLIDALARVVNASGVSSFPMDMNSGVDLLYAADNLAEWLGSNEFKNSVIPDEVDDTPEDILNYIEKDR